MQMDQAAYEAIQPELISGESVLWAGRPNPSVIFHQEDLYVIPFSLLWGGFAIFWEAGVLGLWGTSSTRGGEPIFMQLWGVPFIVIGQYMIWGRFLVDAWKKRQTFYAVTNRRVIVIQNLWNRRTAAAYIDTLPTIDRESRSDGIGTLRFNERPSVFGRRQKASGSWDSSIVDGVPVFRDIDDIETVYRLVADLRNKTT
jgi:hypothetical protein